MAESQDGKHNDRGAQAKNASRERRATHRVHDDQAGGAGSATALSKLKMLERKRAPIRALRDDIV